MITEFVSYENPVYFDDGKLKVDGHWIVKPGYNCYLKRKSDGKEVYGRTTLCVEYRDISGNLLEHPYVEIPDDYDEIPIEDVHPVDIML